MQLPLAALYFLFVFEHTPAGLEKEFHVDVGALDGSVVDELTCLTFKSHCVASGQMLGVGKELVRLSDVLDERKFWGRHKLLLAPIRRSHLHWLETLD